MNNFVIYNKSSKTMSEIGDASMNLIMTSPPYGIGTTYGNSSTDDQSFVEYCKLMTGVIGECFRVLKGDGTLIIEVADTIMREGRFIQLAGLLQSIALKTGFHLWQRHINFVNSDNGVELSEESTEEYFSKKNAHSNCHQWLVFSKESKPFAGGDIFYFNYLPSEEHPCPTPDAICQKVLDLYFQPRFAVLDPFMGIASIGKEVLIRGGIFSGYELDPAIYTSAKKRLESV
jgi:site-specific DNA-methyltransferase (adenine-specific)